MSAVFMPTELPLEIVELILAQLEIKDKAQLTGVNRAWNDFLNTNTGVWSVLNFGDSIVNTKTLELFCAKAGYKVTICRMKYTSSDTDIRVLRQCRRLKELEFGEWAGNPLAGLDENDLAAFALMDTLILHPDVLPKLQPKSAMNIISKCLQLKNLQLGFNNREPISSWTASLATNVKVFRLVLDPRGDVVHFGSTLLGMAHSLEELAIWGPHTFADMRHLENLSSLTLDGCEQIHNWQMPASLRSLNINDYNSWLLERALPIMQNLEELQLSRIAAMDQKTSSKIMEKVGTKLKYLWLSAISPNGPIVINYTRPGRLPSALPLLLQHCQSLDLRRLGIDVHQDHMVPIFDSIGSKFSSLMELSLQGDSMLESIALENLVEELPLLERLSLTSHKVEEVTLEAIRERGICVEKY